VNHPHYCISGSKERGGEGGARLHLERDVVPGGAAQRLVDHGRAAAVDLLNDLVPSDERKERFKEGGWKRVRGVAAAG
jgi:hypothetical protein